ncbi:TfoX/Sxy family protein [Methanoculleus frigidifontis]|uniref:TfoX/Sxy family protein n=1 Tax=Methanoculleus frigidifontis TaxID=2584085 RepID=UPI0034642684
MRGIITYRKMFGEYGFNCDGKFFACVCDNRFFVKITEQGKEFMPDGKTAPPYTRIPCAPLPAPIPGKRRGYPNTLWQERPAPYALTLDTGI